VLGGWYGKNNTGNLEEIIKAHPDVMISMGDVMGTTVAERVQEQTHIPVVVLSGDLKKLPETYMKAAELLGNQERAAMLAAECRHTIEEIESKVSAIACRKKAARLLRRRANRIGDRAGELDALRGPDLRRSTECGLCAQSAGVWSYPGFDGTSAAMESRDTDLRLRSQCIAGRVLYQGVDRSGLDAHCRAVRNREVY